VDELTLIVLYDKIVNQRQLYNERRTTAATIKTPPNKTTTTKLI